MSLGIMHRVSFTFLADVNAAPESEGVEQPDPSTTGASPIAEELPEGSPESEAILDLDESLDEVVTEPPSAEVSPVEVIEAAPGPEDDLDASLLIDEPPSVEDTPVEESLDAVDETPSPEEEDLEASLLIDEPPSVEISPVEESLDALDETPSPEEEDPEASLLIDEPPSVEISPVEESLDALDEAPETEVGGDAGSLEEISVEPPSVEISPLQESPEAEIMDAEAPGPEDDVEDGLLADVIDEPPSVEDSPVAESLDATDEAPGPEDEVEAAFLDDISTESPAGEGAPLEEIPDAEMIASEAPGPESDSDLDIDAIATDDGPQEESIIDEAPSTEDPVDETSIEPLISEDAPEPEAETDIDATPVDEASIDPLVSEGVPEAEAGTDIDATPVGEQSSGEDTFVAEMTFADLDYNELNSDPARLESFTGSISASVAAATGVPEENVKVLRVRPGSVIVDTEITVPEGGGTMDDVSSILRNPAVFDEGFTQEFGTPLVAVTEKEVTLDVPQEAGAGIGSVTETVEGSEPVDEDHDDEDDDHEDDDHDDEDDDHDDHDDEDKDHDDDHKDHEDDDDHEHLKQSDAHGVMGLSTVLLAIGTAVMMPNIWGFY
ncbi:hypothetical protein BSKO_12415 [Bryopsis sp. KO-2023]|nr:hypothetical protein BSKO_12415 [Bryopsis sp. KO-2023]